MSECPVCMEVKPLMLFPCTHAICEDCHDRVRACPTCRTPGQVRPHQPIHQLSQLLHCGHCQRPYSEEVVPVLTLPCHHHMCRACLESLEGCTTCSETVTGGIDDSRFMDLIGNMSRLPPPPQHVTNDPLIVLGRWLDSNTEVYTMSWASNACTWSEKQRQLWNHLMQLIVDLGKSSIEADGMLLFQSTGLPLDLKKPILSTLHLTRQVCKSRQSMPQIFRTLPMATFGPL